jgi:predicted glycosyltransferase
LKKIKTLFLLYYSQSFGHARIALSLASHALAHSDCVLVNGGAPLVGIHIPESLTIQNLEPLTSAVGIYDGVRPLSSELSLEMALNKRATQFDELLSTFIPDVLVVDFFPFGRMFLKDEFLHFITQVKKINPKCQVVCSTREIIAKSDDEEGKLEKHTRRINKILEEYFDHVWIHAEKEVAPAFDIELNSENLAKTFYTGYLPPLNWKKQNHSEKDIDILAMAGGGSIGDETLENALAICKKQNLKAVFITGPFYPAGKKEELKKNIQETSIELLESNENITELIYRAEIIFSMAGYGTICDLLFTNAKAILFPKRLDEEQLMRALELRSHQYFETVSFGESLCTIIEKMEKLRALKVDTRPIVDDNYFKSFISDYYSNL